MFKQRIDFHKRISDSQNILREKFKKFKRGEHFVEESVNKVFRPIIAPLNKLVDNSNTQRLIENSNSKLKKRVRHSTPEPEISSDLEQEDDMWKFATAQTSNYGKNVRNINDTERSREVGKEEEEVKVFPEELEISSSQPSHHSPILEKEDNSKQKEPLLITSTPRENKNIIHCLNKVKKKDNTFDMVSGVRKLTKGYRFGDSSFSHKGKFFKIKGEQYEITPGLTELVFKKDPNPEFVNENDVQNYANLVIKTNAHRNNYKATNPIRVDKSKKFQTYLSNVITGGGFKIAKKTDVTEYVYWNDPNELVERFRLLDAEKLAGNNNHGNEIKNILEELGEPGYI